MILDRLYRPWHSSTAPPVCAYCRPIRVEKRPSIGKWKTYQTRLPTETELSAWFRARSGRRSA